MSVDTSASADDAVHLINLAITNMVSNSSLKQQWKSVVEISGITAGGDINIGDCDSVTQSSNVRDQFKSQLDASETANASLMAQLTADSEINLHNAAKQDLDVNENTHTVTRLLIADKNKVMTTIHDSCVDDADAGTTYIMKNFNAGNDVNINLEQNVLQNSTLKCTIKGLVKTNQDNSGGISDTQSDTSKLTVSNSPAINFSSVLGIIIAVILVLMVTSMVKEARVLLASLIACAGLVCAGAGVFLTFGFGSFGVPMSQLSKKYDSSSKTDQSKWVQSALIPFRRNWFVDNENIAKDGGAPVLSGYKLFTPPAGKGASPDLKNPKTGVYVDKISEAMKAAHDADMTVVGCVWHRDKPYETILGNTMPGKTGVVVQLPGASDTSFWSADTKDNGVNVAKVDGTECGYSGLFECLQLSDPTVLRSNASGSSKIVGATGTLYLYTLDDNYKLDQLNTGAGNYLNCMEDTDLKRFPGVSEGWPAGMVSATGKQSTLVYDAASGEPTVGVYSQKAFPMSKDASGLIGDVCEQSCMVVGATEIDGSYTPMAISDKIVSGSDPSELDSGLDFDTKFNMEKVTIPFISNDAYKGVQVAKSPWAGTGSRGKFYNASFKTVSDNLKTFWTNAKLDADTDESEFFQLGDPDAPKPIRIRKPIKTNIPAPGGSWQDEDIGDDKKGIWRSFRKDEAGQYTCAESLFPAWAIANRVLAPARDDGGTAANPTDVANSVMQFMVMPLTNAQYPGKPCTDQTEQCTVNELMLQMFAECCIIIVIHAVFAVLGSTLVTSGMLSGIFFTDTLIFITGWVALVGVVVLTITQGIWSRGIKTIETQVVNKAEGDCTPCTPK
jgi:hypothetical protein